MSKLIASAAIRGAHKLVARAEKAINDALKKYGPDKKVEFPNTGYYAPIIYGMTGFKVQTVGDLLTPLGYAKALLGPIPTKSLWLPFLGHTLDAGIAALYADEIIEILKYLETPLPYVVAEVCPETGNFYLGAADDVIMRKRGVQFVDGSAPGVAACVGACKDNKTAVKIARDLQEKNIYTVMFADGITGKCMADQLREEGVQMGWETRLVPLSKDVTGACFALGFAIRAAMAFGGVKPGDGRRALLYNKNRVFAFVLAFGDIISDEQYAQAAGAINFGFPVITEADIPEILPTGVCTYEHVVSNVPAENMVAKAIEVRGLKLVVTKVPIPVAYGAAFEGERIRAEDVHVEMGGMKTPTFEYLVTRNLNEVEDGKIEVIGKDLDSFPPGSKIPFGMLVEVAGRNMQPDFEPILERQLHRFLNGVQGVFHMGQRDQTWLRISKDAAAKGFRLAHLGTVAHAKFHAEYSAVADKVQVKIYTREEDVLKLREIARKAYSFRDERVGAMTDEGVDVFYSCTLCQSFAPTHACIITPERTGLCGAYTWFDGKAAYQLKPTGPNQPIQKGECLDAKKGQWKGVNDFIRSASKGKVECVNAYSLMEFPMTSCGCFECLSVVQPAANGVMIVNRDFFGMTPCGMKFSTLAGTCGGGQQMPGFMGHSKRYITSKKYLLAEGGIGRVVWMPKMLKEELKPLLTKRLQELGMPNLLEQMADETVATTEEETAAYIRKTGHPATKMAPIM